MNKFVKITLVLFSICLICSLAVAGVNMITEPIIEEYQAELKAEAYLELFPDMSAANTEYVSSGFSSSYVTEKAIVRDEDGNLLGYGLVVSGTNTYGTITLVVGIDTEGLLIGINCTENGQTGGRNTMINTYLTYFSSGMSATDIEGVSTYSGATYGSNLVKNLLAAAFAEVGIMSEIQETLVGIFGDSVDMGYTTEDDVNIYAQQILEGYEVRDTSNSLLGYYYDVKVTNRFGYVELAVALNADYTLNQVEALDISQTAGRDEMLEDIFDSFTSGMTTSDIEDVEVISGATYGSNSVKQAILVAINEAQDNFDEDLALSIMFSSYSKTAEITDDLLDGVDKYQEVLNSSNETVGYTVTVNDSNTYGNIKLYVGLTVSDGVGSLAGIFILENNQTEGRDSSVTEYISNFSSDMSISDVNNVEVVSNATLGSNLAKSLILLAFEQATEETIETGYDSYYEQAFDNVDLSNSQDIEYSGTHIEEAKALYDSEGNLLGYAYILSSTNSLAGVVTVMVAVNTDGTLHSVQDIVNTQTGTASGLLDDYYQNFTDGMSSSDINNVSNVAGATIGSEQYKELILEALSEILTYTDYYKTIFGNDITTVTLDISNMRSEILEAVEVYDSSDKLVGYAYIVSLENVYGYNIMCVGLNTDGTFKQLLDVENNHADLTEIASVFVDGSSMLEIVEQGNSDAAITIGASYTSEIASLGIRIAMEACSGTTDEDVSLELYINSFFQNAVYRRTVDTTANIINNTVISKAYEIYGTVNYANGTLLGYLYIIEVENDDIAMTLVVAIDSDNNYIGSEIISYTTLNQININGSFGDTLQGKVESYLEELVGMSDDEIRRAAYYYEASYASQLVKYALRVCIAESKESAYSGTTNLYDNSLIWVTAIEDINLIGVQELSDFIYDGTNGGEGTIAGIMFADGSKAYIIRTIDVYSTNYILVYLSSNNTLISIYDVENNHGSLEESSIYFETGMTEDVVEATEYYPWDSTEAHSSYTVEAIRQAILIAMKEASGVSSDTITDLDRELAVKEIFPFAVYNRCVEITDINSEYITFAMEVYGVSNYVAGTLLGYVFEVTYEHITIMVGLDTNGDYISYVSYDDTANIDDILETIKTIVSQKYNDIVG